MSPDNNFLNRKNIDNTIHIKITAAYLAHNISYFFLIEKEKICCNNRQKCIILQTY